MIAIFKKIGIDYDSSFLDIGSGFGKVVIHFACETNADCWGYEIVTARC